MDHQETHLNRQTQRQTSCMCIKASSSSGQLALSRNEVVMVVVCAPMCPPSFQSSKMASRGSKGELQICRLTPVAYRDTRPERCFALREGIRESTLRDVCRVPRQELLLGHRVPRWVPE
ncbi:hypothetical protein E3N88_39722 [Mikania micrantha]|uniref:Uncharacterized protein n=1 Tax=Mikania micrantha TaxID=192012 RepID=A0A5N6LKL6_9ASTR|nr:hypothetical protein E3N88_39722 [Mikania micrantha]